MGKKIFRKATSLVLAFMMVFTIGFIYPNTSNAADKNEKNVYVTFENAVLNNGSGFLVEPVKVDADLNENAAEIILDVAEDYNLKPSYFGTTASGFYLTGLKDTNTNPINPDKKVADACGNTFGEKAKADMLSAGDYTADSGWMLMVNNEFLNVGPSDYIPKEGDVLRLQFSLYGYGADIGADNSSWGGSAPLAPLANKDALIKVAADLEDAEDELMLDKNIKANYDKAIAVLGDLFVDQASVDAAKKALVESIEAYKPAAATLKVDKATCYTVKLSWKKVEGVDGYKLYRKVEGSTQYKLFKTLKDDDFVSYVDDNRLSARHYDYMIKTYVNYAGKKLYSEPSYASATTMPLRPKITKAYTTRNSVTLDWNSVKRVDGYEVYRYIGGKYVKLADLPSITTSYIHTGRYSANIYTYSVRAYRYDKNNKKVYSNYAYKKKTVTKPLTPKVTLSSTTKGKVDISWVNRSSKTTGYEIYMSERLTGSYNLVKTTSKASYTKSGLKSGKRYYFKVKAYRLVDSNKYYGNESTVKSIVCK